MKYTRLYTGPDGESHFEDIAIVMEDTGGGRPGSKVMKADSIFFRESRTWYNPDWHHPTHRQFVITLDGEVDIVSGAGVTRRFGPGDVFLAEDMTGRGHMTRIVQGKPWQVAFIPLE